MNTARTLLRGSAGAACLLLAACVTAPSRPSAAPPSATPPAQSSTSSSSPGQSSASATGSSGQSRSTSSSQPQSAEAQQNSGARNGGTSASSQDQSRTAQSPGGETTPGGSSGGQQAPTAGENGAGSASATADAGRRSEDQVLSEAMEVFDATMRNNQGEGGSQPAAGNRDGTAQNGGANPAAAGAGQGGDNPDRTAQNGTRPGGGTDGTAAAGQQQAAAAGTSGTAAQAKPGEQAGTPGSGGTAAGTGAAAGGGGTGTGGNEPGGQAGGARTDAEQRAALERKLGRQMADFDGMILQRRADVIADENREGGSSGQHTYGAGGGSAYPGDEGGEAPPLLTATAEDTTGNVRTRGQNPAAEAADRKGDYKEGQADARRDDRIPDDIPSGDDDDIVARQLREAAINEDDPELRAKLWDEYRKYKKGIQAKR